MIALVLIVIATIVRLSLKQWVVISIFAHVKKLDRALLMMISNAEPRKEKRMSFEKITFQKNDTLLKKCGSVVGWINLKTM